jgi:hypothetical protein
LISAPELSKHLTTPQCSSSDATDVIKCLLSSGADINLYHKDGQSPLFIASMYGHCDVFRCLLSSVADISLRDKYGRSPLFIASKYGRCDGVQCLLSSGADINLYDDDGQSPLRNNGDCPHLSRKLIATRELSKDLTTSQWPFAHAANNGDCPSSSYKLISAPELSKR